MVIIIGILVSVSTLLGGLFALRFNDKLHLILGFSAGAVIGVAFFDLLPEAIDLSINFSSIQTTLALVAGGFIIYMILDRIFDAHGHALENQVHDHAHDHSHENEARHRSSIRAGSISLHSFLDGIAIGLSFQVSAAVGIVVAVAVLAHDFSDGINTVSAVLKGGGSKKKAMKWLYVDAIAPFAGVICTLFFTVSNSVLGTVLSLFAGFFLYIGASDLVPESYHGHPTKWTTLATVLGLASIAIIVTLAG